MRPHLFAAAYLLLYTVLVSGEAGGGGTCEKSESLEDVIRPVEDRHKYVFVGGKGGSGKTTIAGTIAVKLTENHKRVLLLSTDPAHSLADYFRREVVSNGKILRLLNSLFLFVLEVNPQNAMGEFESKIDEVVNKLQSQHEYESPRWKAISALRDMFSSLPPGADEFIAIARMLRISKTRYDGYFFDSIVVDLAPTGHTLRLLATPSFLQEFVTRSIQLVDEVLSGFRDSSEEQKAAVKDALGTLSTYHQEIDDMWALIRNINVTEFVVVCHPTVVSAAETKRLVEALDADGIKVKHLVANMVVARQPTERFSDLMSKLSIKQTVMAERVFDRPYEKVRVPHQLQEPRGLYMLRKLAKDMMSVPEVNRRYGQAISPNMLDTHMVGVVGKGGVGKTAISCALGVHLASKGLKTLILSTDPAHSLSDMLAFDLTKGKITEVPGTDGNLFGLEIDVRQESSAIVSLLHALMEMHTNLADADSAFIDTLPPGSDEIIAVSHVYQQAKSGDYHRIILDTAPTAQALRMFTIPKYVDRFVRHFTGIAQTLDEASRHSKGVIKDLEIQARQTLDELAKGALEFKHMVTDESKSTFMAVLVPLEIVTRETKRLTDILSNEGIKTRTIIINQVYPMEDAGKFFKELRMEQDAALAALKEFGNKMGTKVVHMPHLDRDVHGVEGSLYLGDELFDLRLQREACGEIQPEPELTIERPWRPQM
mmetsp:Transcript_8349/g.25092  ORF Transcript_8349/g.25092 Transcript_8349/m.25092 type:complete len:711 (+) Transcript_8349:88-2220(+)